MKRIVAAVSFTVLAVPALAVEISRPFEQPQFDRALPIILDEDSERASAGGTSAKESVWAQDHNFIAPAP